MNFNEAIEAINAYLASSATKYFTVNFAGGFFIKIKKRVVKHIQCIEIHTSGFDDILPSANAIEWIKWTLLDYHANHIC